MWLNTLNKSDEQLKTQDEKITLAKAQYERLEREITELIAQSDIAAIESNKLSSQIDAIRREAAKADEESSEIKGQIAVLNNNILPITKFFVRYFWKIAEYCGIKERGRFNRRPLIILL